MVYKRKRTVTGADMNDSTGKKGKSLDTDADIISNLPTDVLYKIVECLPLRDAARTSVLSHKWHQIWISIPSLVFDDHFFYTVLKTEVYKSALKFCGIVSKILLQHEGPILKFALSVPSVSYTPDVTQWMSYLSRHGIRDFSLYNKHNSSIELSSQLYSWVGLEKLKLNTCTIVSSLKFRGFPKLTILELVKVLIPYNILKDVIGCCPLLEKLELTDCVGLHQRNVIIDAPKLRCFVISSEFHSLEVKNGENLVSALIVMPKMPLLPSKACCNDLINALECSSKLEMLALGGCLCRVLFRQGHRPNIFQKLKNLELLSLVLNDLDDFLSTIDCIRSLSNVERLKISVHTSQNLNDDVLDYNPDWTLQHLRRANVIIRNASNIEMKLIDYLLGCSPVLENFSLSFITAVSQSIYSKMLMQLNQFRRLSQKVVVCPEPLIEPEKFYRCAASEASSSSSESRSDFSSFDEYSDDSSDDPTSDSDSSEFSDSY